MVLKAGKSADLPPRVWKKEDLIKMEMVREVWFMSATT